VHSMMHAATSKVENSAQGSSCKLKFVHEWTLEVWANNTTGFMTAVHIPMAKLTSLFVLRISDKQVL
jgi:hypothetical protein